MQFESLFHEVSMQDNFRQSVQRLQLKPDFDACKLVDHQLLSGSIPLPCNTVATLSVMYNCAHRFLLEQSLKTMIDFVSHVSLTDEN